ncbi:MAG: ParB N-terminal domain-containing protein [Lachnospiraceae bacterium]|nr:ParB N-terminal domain-containing protein [Lachnospiraceae bacterium]
MDREIKEIGLELLVPFKMHSGQMYEGERLQQMMNSIKQSGVISPIIVRPVDSGKYEIICGHNRTKAVKELGYDSILADIRYELSDDEAVQLYYDSNLNQQSFSDWSYSQRIEAVKYFEKYMKKNSRQGKRTDLETKKCAKQDDETYVQSRQKLDSKSKQTTTRDKMARSLGISTATLSKYRRIAKLPDDLTQSIIRLIDEKRITFDAAYSISALDKCNIKLLVKYIDKASGKKIDMNKLMALCARKKGNVLSPILSRSEFKDILIQEDITLIPMRS